MYSSSRRSTNSPTLKGGAPVFHLERALRVGRYSFFHLLQNSCPSPCTWRHFFRLKTSDGLVSIIAAQLRCGPSKIWFGVSGSKSLASSDTCVSGLLLTMLSASVNTVCNCESVSVLFCRIPCITSLTDRTSLSQAPPICGAFGGLNCHSIWRLVAKSLMASWLRPFMNSFSSVEAPTKLDPLSENILRGQPRRLVNLRNELMNASVSAVSTVSRCTQRTVKQVYKHTHRFNSLRPCLTVTGPNKSAPQFQNGGSPTAARAVGRLAIMGYCSFARRT